MTVALTDVTDPKTHPALGDAVDLLSIDTTAPRPWTPGAHRILRPGLRCIVFGPRGIGKSFAQLLLGLQVIEAGGNVVYLDLENGERRQAERLGDILADRKPELSEQVRDRLRYHPRVRFGAIKDPEEWVQGFPGSDLVIVDSIARALGQLGLDENGAADFSRFMCNYIDPIAEAGAVVLLADNVGWSDAERSRGSSTKWDLVELVFRTTATPFGPDRSGAIQLERVRTRDGDEATELEVKLGAGSYGRLRQALPDERTDRLDRELRELIAATPGQTTNELCKQVKRRRQDTASRLAALEAAGTHHRTHHDAASERRDAAGRTTTVEGWYAAPPSQTRCVPNARTHQNTAASEWTPRPADAPLGADGGRTTARNRSPDGWSDTDLQALIDDSDTEPPEMSR